MHLVFLTPSLDPAGGGQAFNAGLIPALRALDHTIDVRHDAQDLPAGAVPVVDGLLLPDLEPELTDLLAADAIAIVHHVSAKAGRNEEAKAMVAATEARMLPRIRRVVATSASVADRLRADFGVVATLLQPGLPNLPRATGSDDGTCRIVSVGVLTPRKGHDRLLHALVRLLDLDWTLTIAGDAARDPVHAETVAALIDTLGLAHRVTLLPDPSEATLEPIWQAADLFVLASSWEGWPAGIAEALRRGIPVVAAEVGGIPALVPQTAGIVYAPDDPATFGKCLRRALFDRSLRTALAEGAWQAGLSLPGWPQQALAFQTILDQDT